MKKIQCYNCEKWGHYAANCWHGRGKQKKVSDDAEAHVAQDDSEEEPVVLMVTTSEEEFGCENWFLDTGCSNHMTGHKEWLSNIDISRSNKIKLTDDNVIKAEGVGNVVIKKDEKETMVIEDVLYVPGMKCNLLSVGQLVQKGFSVSMKEEVLKVYDARKRLVLKSPLAKNRTFHTRLILPKNQCLKATTTEDMSWLWHRRYGHLNFSSLKKLADRGMVTGLPETLTVPGKVCEDCLVGKQPRNAFKKQMHMRAKGLLQVVYSNVCGPFEELSLGQNKYFVTFIDEYSRMIWLYLIKAKLEVFSVFKRFKLMTENQSGKLVQILRTDGERSICLMSLKLTAVKMVCYMKLQHHILHKIMEWQRE